MSVDGIEQHDKTILLIDDHKEHWVEVRIHLRTVDNSASAKVNKGGVKR